MQRDPLPARPTNADLARAMEDVHECVEAVGARVDKLEAKMDVIMVALGVQAHQAGEAKPVLRVGLLTPWQLTWRTALGFVSTMALWQWISRISPALWDFLVNVNHLVSGS